VKADPSQMEQVLVNLVLNARDAMPMGGHLAIETSNVDLDEERISTERLNLDLGAYVMLAVRDTGSGMDAETRDRVFEPFFTTKAKGKGTGFGLPTVYGIIDQSGGAISMDTAPGRGTSIRIYLPVTEEAAERQPEPQAVFTGGGNETLLVVEDNDAVRELAVHALRKRGYTVHEARNGEEAIEWSAASSVKPDLLVTDVVMPGLSGPNLAARLLQQNPRLRVLYMSGYTEDATSVHGTLWGGIPMLQKPFTPSQLNERVRLALDTTADRA
jgi:two-component system, cell cycle sensor histidine kinase and response regulator CckA